MRLSFLMVVVVLIAAGGGFAVADEDSRSDLSLLDQDVMSIEKRILKAESSVPACFADGIALRNDVIHIMRDMRGIQKKIKNTLSFVNWVRELSVFSREVSSAEMEEFMQRKREGYPISPHLEEEWYDIHSFHSGDMEENRLPHLRYILRALQGVGIYTIQSQSVLGLGKETIARYGRSDIPMFTSKVAAMEKKLQSFKTPSLSVLEGRVDPLWRRVCRELHHLPFSLDDK